MNWDQMRKLETVQRESEAAWGKLTDDELDVIAGKRDDFVGKVQEKYGITKEEAQNRSMHFRNLSERIPNRKQKHR